MALWFICRKVGQLLFAELNRLCRVIYSFLISGWVGEWLHKPVNLPHSSISTLSSTANWIQFQFGLKKAEFYYLITAYNVCAGIKEICKYYEWNQIQLTHTISSSEHWPQQICVLAVIIHFLTMFPEQSPWGWCSLCLSFKLLILDNIPWCFA